MKKMCSTDNLKKNYVLSCIGLFFDKKNNSSDNVLKKTCLTDNFLKNYYVWRLF